MVSSGQTVLNRGTILGFSDPNGFDQLLASASLANSPIITDAIAIDNLKVQLVPVPEPTTATLALLGAGVLALSKPFRRK